MVMAIHIGIETGSRSVHRKFADKARARKRMQGVVHRGAGCSRVGPVDSVKNVLRCGMHVMPHQVFHHEEALRRTAQTSRAKCVPDRFLQIIQDISLD
ncbi:MAG: hypothetical protein JWO80_5500 [Bryobacterales bacterium]|nr:hypothetical protein [Bryobacterales bacterium]